MRYDLTDGKLYFVGRGQRMLDLPELNPVSLMLDLLVGATIRPAGAAVM